MKYYELTFHTTPVSETVNDVLSSLLAEVGFETFLTNEEGQLQAYVQQALFSQSSVDELLEFFPLPDTAITYELSEPEDLNWNETWENEGFEPIYVDRKLVVCDTRHTIDPSCVDDASAAERILIHPRQAFGTGSHQTTRMILSTLLNLNLEGKDIIDAGCGTGILGFMCLKRGANHVFAYDIDEWSVQNTLDNVLLNTDIAPYKLEVRLGDSSVLEGQHDMLIANINRNILLADMPRFMQALKPKAHILFSGFYQDDVTYLTDAVEPHGFRVVEQRNDGEWAMLLLERQ